MKVTTVLSASAKEFVPGRQWEFPLSADSPLVGAASSAEQPHWEPLNQRICQFHDGRGGCRNGAQCPFFHTKLPTDASNEVFVGNLDVGITDAAVHCFFSRYGEVLKTYVKDDYGFVTFMKSSAAKTAIKSGHPVWDVKARRADVWVARKMDPLAIRFSHDTISFCFRNGTRIDDAIQHIIDGSSSFAKFPPLEVVEHAGKYYSLSNRRLFVARVLATQGMLQEIDVRLFKFNSERVQHLKNGRTKWARSFSTVNEGFCAFAACPCGVCNEDHESVFMDQQAGVGFNYQEALRQATRKFMVDALKSGGLSKTKNKELTRMLRAFDEADNGRKPNHLGNGSASPDGWADAKAKLEAPHRSRREDFDDRFGGGFGLYTRRGADKIYAEAKVAYERGDVDRAAELAYEATMVDTTIGPPFTSELIRGQASNNVMKWGMGLSQNDDEDDCDPCKFEHFEEIMKRVNRRLGIDFESDSGSDSDARPKIESTTTHLSPGTMARIEGLQTRSELNGLVGRIARYAPDRERYAVELTKHGDKTVSWQSGSTIVELGIKLVNLVIVDTNVPVGAVDRPGAAIGRLGVDSSSRPDGGAARIHDSSLQVADKVYFNDPDHGGKRLGTLEKPHVDKWRIRRQDFSAVEVKDVQLAKSSWQRGRELNHILDVRTSRGGRVDYVKVRHADYGVGGRDKPVMRIRETRRPDRLPLLFPGYAKWKRNGIREKLNRWTKDARLASKLAGLLQTASAGQRELDGHWVHYQWVIFCADGLEETKARTLEEWNAINIAAGCTSFPAKTGTDRGQRVGYDVIRDLYGKPQRKSCDEPSYDSPVSCDFCGKFGMDLPQCECGEIYCSAACRLADWEGHKRLCVLAVCGNQCNNHVTRLYWIHERGIHMDVEGMPLDIQKTPDYEPDDNELAASAGDACKQQ